MRNKISEFELALIWELINGKYSIKKIDKNWNLIRAFEKKADFLHGTSVVTFDSNEDYFLGLMNCQSALETMMRNFRTLVIRYDDFKTPLSKIDSKLIKKVVAHKSLHESANYEIDTDHFTIVEFEINIKALRIFFEEKLKLFKQNELKLTKDFRSYKFQKVNFLRLIKEKLNNGYEEERILWEYPISENSNNQEFKDICLLLDIFSFEIDGCIRIKELRLNKDECSIIISLKNKVNLLLKQIEPHQDDSGHLPLDGSKSLDENIVFYFPRKEKGVKPCLYLNQRWNGKFECKENLSDMKAQLINFVYIKAFSAKKGFSRSELAAQFGYSDGAVNNAIKAINDVCQKKQVKHILTSTKDATWQLNPDLDCWKNIKKTKK